MLARLVVTQTPLKLQTTSVPTTGKFFKVEDVNNDLVVELRGATIEEELLNDPSHYILVLCSEISPRTTQNLPSDNDPLKITSLLLNNEFLYRNGRWEPTKIPKLLRSARSSEDHPSTSLPTRGRSSRGTKSSRAQRGRTSTHPKQRGGSGRGVRTETVHRRIPGTSQEESVQGTFIPVAGSEERQVANWLNEITRALEPFVPPVPVTSDKVLTRSATAMPLRCWSSETSRKSIKDGLMLRKPDIILHEKLTKVIYGPWPEFSWKNVISFIELTSSPYSFSDSLGTIRGAITRKAKDLYEKLLPQAIRAEHHLHTSAPG